MPDATSEESLLVHTDASEFEFVSIELSSEIVNVLLTESVLLALLDESEPDVCDEELETFVTLDSSDSFPESPESLLSTSSYSWIISCWGNSYFSSDYCIILRFNKSLSFYPKEYFILWLTCSSDC